MSKKIFLILSLIYAVIITFLQNANNTFFEYYEIGAIIGAIIGSWILIGLIPYFFTHLGKGRKSPSRDNFAILLSTILFAMITYRTVLDIQYSHKQPNSYKATVSNEDISSWINYCIEVFEKENALVAFLSQNNPSFRTKIYHALYTDWNNNPLRGKDLIKKWKGGNIMLSDLDYLQATWIIIEKEFAKYMLFASDDDIYNMLKTEHKHISKNKCNTKLSEKDNQETIQAKITLMKNSLKNRNKTKQLGEKELKQTFKQVANYYTKKGYNPNNLLRYLQHDKSLSENEKCIISMEYVDAILSLPKETCASLMRTIMQMDIG